MTHTLPNDMGNVVFANEDEIELGCGITLAIGEAVFLPEVAGGKRGTVDDIHMEFDPEKMAAIVVLRIVEDDTEEGHRFEWRV